MLNVTVLIGRLVADPELRHTASDVAVTSFTIAVDRSYVKSGTERQTDFIDIVAWRNTAEFVCRNFHKGKMIAVHGSIQTRTYTDKDGNKRKAVEVLADEVNFCGDRKDDSIPISAQINAIPVSQTARNPTPPVQTISSEDTQQQIGDLLDDDIPF